MTVIRIILLLLGWAIIALFVYTLGWAIWACPPTHCYGSQGDAYFPAFMVFMLGCPVAALMFILGFAIKKAAQIDDSTNNGAHDSSGN